PSKTISGYEIVSSTTDENGNVVHTYRKVAKKTTSFVDENGNPLAPQEDGKQPSKTISGYEIVSSTTDENGNVVHTYRKVAKKTTSFVDENGNPIVPNEEGNQPSKDLPEYELVSSTTDENGNTVHTYRKVAKKTTSFVDENGNPIVPNEEGNQPSKDLPEYELVSSTTDENGNTVHTYRKVSKPSTRFVDEEGNPLAPQEDGKQPSKTISGYEIVSSTTDENGNVVHTYRKVITPEAPQEPVKPSQPAKVEQPVKPVAPSQPAAPAKAVEAANPQPAEPTAPKTENKLTVLPNTGTESTTTATAVGVGMILASLGLVGKRRRKED
ncbi:MucBP domain-containing protein, partial [Streptococcus cuniculipharyngis]